MAIELPLLEGGQSYLACQYCPAKNFDGYKYVCDQTKLDGVRTICPQNCPLKVKSLSLNSEASKILRHRGR